MAKLVKKNKDVNDLIKPFTFLKKLEAESKSKQKMFYEKLLDYGFNKGKPITDKTLSVRLEDGEIQVTIKTTQSCNQTLAKAVLPPEVYQSILLDEIDIKKLKDLGTAGIIDQELVNKILQQGEVKSLKVIPNEYVSDENKWKIEEILKEFKEK